METSTDTTLSLEVKVTNTEMWERATEGTDSPVPEALRPFVEYGTIAQAFTSRSPLAPALPVLVVVLVKYDGITEKLNALLQESGWYYHSGLLHEIGGAMLQYYRRIEDKEKWKETLLG